MEHLLALSVTGCGRALTGPTVEVAAAEEPKESASVYTVGVAGRVPEHVTSIAVDHDGAMWFGTSAGVARYDPPN